MTIEVYVEDYVENIEPIDGSPVDQLSLGDVKFEIENLRAKLRSAEEMLIQCNIRFTRSRGIEDKIMMERIKMAERRTHDAKRVKNVDVFQ